MRTARIAMLTLLVLSCGPLGESAPIAGLPKLKVSANGRFLVKEDGTPFFPLVDTAWYLPKVSNADVSTYLADRASRGFTATMISAKYHNDVLFNGAGPFLNNNTDTPNETYWQHMDFIVDEAARYGLYVGFTIMWCEDWWAMVGTDAQKSYRLGNWLGTRYRNRTNIYWIVSGEFPDGTWTKAVYDGAAQGLKDGQLGNHLMTIHPGGSGTLNTSSEYFHNATWLDFNMLQSGAEGPNADALGDVYGMITRDYNLSPVKPVFEGESGYEFEGGNGYPSISPDQIRRKAWRSVFAGGFGYTYGHENLEIMFVPGDTPDGYAPDYPHRFWKDSLGSPGAVQMKHLRTLIESRSFLNRIPDQSILVSGAGSGTSHARATRANDGSYAFVYIPDGRAMTVDMSKISGTQAACSWYDPRTGATTSIGTYPNSGTRTFDPPGATAVGNDWVLVMDAQGSSPGLPAIADTFVKENDGTSYGSLTEIDVKGQSSVIRYGYIKFDTSSLTGTLQQAKLQLRLLPSADWADSGTASVCGFSDNSWTESTVWSNRPSDAALGSTLGSIPLPVIQDQTLWDIDVTAFVNARRSAGSTTVSFSLRSPSNNNSGLCVYSRETSLPPKLILTAGQGGLTPPVVTSPSDGAVLTGTSVTVTWNPVAAATGYLVRCQDTTTGVLVSYVDMYAGTSFAVPVTDGHSYDFWVHAATSSSDYGPSTHVRFSIGGSFSVSIDSVSTGKAYSLSTAQSGALCYIDRSYTITSISATLSGGRMIRTANDDKAVTTTAHLKFTVSQSANVYVVYCSAAAQLPAWLNDGTWMVVAESLDTTDVPANPRKILKKSVAAGQVTLGGNLASPASGPSGYSNYFVVVKP